MGTILRLVTTGPCRGTATGCTCPACKAGLTRIHAHRAHCEACAGDPERCKDGQGEAGDFARLDGCRAFTDEGKVRPRKARKQPRQPWQTRKAA